MIVSAFPGCGKSYFYNKNRERENYVSDSDSSKFDKAEFPQNYIAHIKDLVEQNVTYILVSSHSNVRQALVDEGLQYVLLYPKREIKEEYIERYRTRGSDASFITLLQMNWDVWMDELEAQTDCVHVRLGAGEFLENVIK